MKRVVVFSLLFLFVASTAPAQTAESPKREIPADFKSDGCSSFPDGDYVDCCVAHDVDYYFGGTEAERKSSDKRLYKCVRKKGHKYLSVMMYIGVRIGAVRWLPTPFRWGFGPDEKEKKEREKKAKERDNDKEKKTESEKEPVKQGGLAEI